MLNKQILSFCAIIFVIYAAINFDYQFQEDMVYVKGGTFTMGAIDDTDENNDNIPAHEVEVSDFYISCFEITHAQYIKFLNSNNVSRNGFYQGNELIDIDGDFCAIGFAQSGFYFTGSPYVDNVQTPVVEVTWYGALEYCNWKSEQEGLNPCYFINNKNAECNWNANGYRLPTEAEWEYAARSRGKDDQKWSGTNDKEDLANFCWYNAEVEKVSIVGSKRPNQIGLYDMSGNAYEWCWDKYSSKYYSRSNQTNPKGPLSGQSRIRRGGSWACYARGCRTTTRHRNEPWNSDFLTGFRIVKTK